MTVLRYLLWMICVSAPLAAWGQVPSRVYSGPESQPGIPFALEPGRVEAGRMIVPGNGAQPGAGFVDDRGAMLPPGLLPPDSYTAGSPGAESGYGPQVEPPLGIARRATRNYSTPLWQSSRNGGYFGFMGAVSQPGVYYNSQERVPLSEMLNQAGGATKEATGAVRIVRQGRGGLQTFLSPESKYELLSGDIVLLEGQRKAVPQGLRQFSSLQAGSNRAGQTPPADSANKAAATSYLAFVNLRAEPIIVPVPADEATLPAVMTWLRQDLKNPPFARVVSPSQQLRINPSLPAEQQVLADGSVLVFDPATVNLARLPQFPPVIGAPAAGMPEPAQQEPEKAPVKENPATEKSPSSLRPAAPNVELLAPPQERPASRATRPPLPIKIPAPPAEPEVQPVPRRESAQAETSGGTERQSWGGGPALFPPQPVGDRHSQSAAPDVGARQAGPSEEISGQRQSETTAASYEGRPMSWQSSSPVGGELNDRQLGVVQAHGEQGHAVEDVIVGPALELPRPVPNIEHEPAKIPAETAATGVSAVPSWTEHLAPRVVWVSLTGMLLLAVFLWCLSRWDGPRPVHARVAARGLDQARENSDAKPGRMVLLAEGQAIRRTDTGSPMKDLGSSVPTVPEAQQPPIPVPVRSISPREHALRAHFRQAVLERGQKKLAIDEVVEPETATPIPDLLIQATPIVSAPAGSSPAVPAPHTPLAPSPAKTSDVLDRVLRAKRGHSAE